MENKLIAKTAISIDAKPAEVWATITSPAAIKKFLMGTTVKTNWQIGSPISYEGEYNGKKYHDKGTILKMEPEKVFQSTYWSSMGGKEDKPENYNKVTYKLGKRNGKTLVTLSQDNVGSIKEKEHVTKNWKMVLKKLKEVAEGY